MYECPEFIEIIKDDVINKRPKLIASIKKESMRLEGAKKFLSSGEKDPKRVEQAIDTMKDITENLISMSKEVNSIDFKTATILESKLTGFSVKFKHEEGDKVSEALFVPEQVLNSEEKNAITPEDIFIYKMLRSTFNIQPDSIEFINHNEKENLFKLEEQGDK